MQLDVMDLVESLVMMVLVDHQEKQEQMEILVPMVKFHIISVHKYYNLLKLKKT